MRNSGKSGGDGRGANRGAMRSLSMASLAPACEQMLKEAGFSYDESIGAWVNLAAGRVIAFDGAAQRTPEWVADLLAHLAR